MDNDEFRLPTDVWKAYNATPQRFEIFDAYQPHNIVQRLKQSEAEIALIHMLVPRCRAFVVVSS